MQKRVRIIDIAKKAGVSKGTVDRVIHKRGNVSEEVRKKVLKVMKELDYQPNIIASSLAYNRNWRIASLLPRPQEDPFWQQPKQGIKQAYQSVRDYGVLIEYFEFKDADLKSFKQEAEKILEGKFDAVLVAPVFYNESHDFLNQLHEQGLKYALINTYLEREDSSFLCYIGQDSFHSGMLAAKLLNFGIEEGNAVMVLHLEKGVYNSKHLIAKEQGFQEFFIKHSERNIEVIKTSFDNPQDIDAFRSFLKFQFESHPNLKGIFVTTSKVHYLKEAMEGLDNSKMKMVGFDLIDANLNHLQEESIDFLINQNPVKQGFLGIINLVNHLILNKEIKPIQHLPLDVVMKENVDYYLEPEKKLHLLF